MSAATVTVDCPGDCGEALEVPLAMTSSYVAGCRLILRIEPDASKVRAHLVERHGADV